MKLWQPKLEGSVNPGMPTYVRQWGKYHREGDLVFFSGEVEISDKADMDGNLMIWSLPETADNEEGMVGCTVTYQAGIDAETVMVPIIKPGTQKMQVNYINPQSGTMKVLKVSDIKNNFRIRFNGIYKAD